MSADTPEMVKRVARAIHAAMDLTDGLDAEAAEVYARAAIAAMREPTEKMLNAPLDPSDYAFGVTVAGSLHEADAIDIWTAMIDEALR